MSPVNARRLANFRANRRGYWSLWIFLCLFFVSLIAELIANDKPILFVKSGELYAPMLFTYTEAELGGELETEAYYREPFMQRARSTTGWLDAIWPLIPYANRHHRLGAAASPTPTPPSRQALARYERCSSGATCWPSCFTDS